MRCRDLFSYLAGTALVLTTVLAYGAAAPSKLSYQAVLQTASGDPVTAPVSVTFTIYDAGSGGNAVWTETRTVTPDAAGRVSVLLGDNTPIADAVFAGADRWLGIQVGADPEMSPRTQLASSAYSRRVSTVDGSTGGTMEGNLTLRSTAAFDKDAEAAQAAQLTLVSLAGDTIIVGPADQLVFSAKNASGAELMSATLSGPNGPVLGIREPGGNAVEHSGTSSSYYGNSAKGVDALEKRLEVGAAGVAVFAPGGSVLTNIDPSTGGITTSGMNISPPEPPANLKSAMAPCGVNAPSLKGEEYQGNLPVGNDNDLTGAASALAVGSCNTIGIPGSQSLLFNAAAFGFQNEILSNQSFVSGFKNFIDLGSSQITIIGSEDTISTDGGLQSSIGSSILGGQKNFIIGPVNTIVSGNGNRITRNAADDITPNNTTIAGGNLNRVSGSSFSFIAGGERNIIDVDSNGSVPFNHGVIGGGADNVVSKDGALVAGGYNNWSRGAFSVVGGGNSNRALGSQATVAGGTSNTAGDGAVVAGGESNTASGLFATVPGGHSNVAAGARSFAAGSGAGANHDGAFVWSDMSGAFGSTGSNQFLIRATGNVGINTNAPTQPLTVAGTVYSTSGGFKFPDGSVQTSAAASITDGWTDDGAAVRLANGTDNVGIGTSLPTEKLHVDGNLKVTGTITSGTSTITMDGTSEEIRLGSGASNTVTIRSTGLGGMVSLKHPGFPDDSTNFGPNSTVFDRTANGASRVKMTAGSEGAKMVMTSTAGEAILRLDASNPLGGYVSLKHAGFPDDSTSFGPNSTVFDRTVNGSSRFTASASTSGATMIMKATSGQEVARLDGTNPLGGILSLKHDGFPNDETKFGPNSTVFDRSVNSASRFTAAATSSGASLDMKSATGVKLIEMDGTNSPSTVHRTTTGPDTCRVGAEKVVLGSGLGRSELSGGLMDFYSFSNNIGVSISGGGEGIKIHNASGNQRLKLSASGVAFDTGGTNAFEQWTPGGTKIFTNAAKTTGAQLAAGGGSWSSLSDVNSKENLRSVDVDQVLEKIAKLNIASWNYKSQDETIRHIGPMAQDLYALFGYGEDERHITTVDADGIALAAIKALHKKTQELDSQKSELNALRDEVAQLRALVEELSRKR